MELTKEEIATRLLEETIAEMPEHLAKQSKEAVWEGELCAESQIMHLYYKKLLDVWPEKVYLSSEDLKRDFQDVAEAKVVKDKKDCWELDRQGRILALRHRLWCIIDEDGGGINVGYTDWIGVGWPSISGNGRSLSVEAIRILDDMTEKVIDKIPNVMPLLKRK